MIVARDCVTTDAALLVPMLAALGRRVGDGTISCATIAAITAPMPALNL